MKNRETSLFWSAILVLVISISFGSILMLGCEQNATDANITTAQDAVWCCFATMSTVGYGDFYPVTMEGRMIAVFMMFVGILLTAIFTGLFAAWILDGKS